jgi:hypothetical protein
VNAGYNQNQESYSSHHHKLPKKVCTFKNDVKRMRPVIQELLRLGSVAGPVIQATGNSTFEDGLRSGASGWDF